jgi:hypothetical protein
MLVQRPKDSPHLAKCLGGKISIKIIKICFIFSRAALLSIFLPLRNWIGGGIAYFSLFVFVGFINSINQINLIQPIFLALIFLFYRLPETKNRNLSEVRREMLQLPRNPLKRIQNNNQQKKKKGWHDIIVNAE